MTAAYYLQVLTGLAGVQADLNECDVSHITLRESGKRLIAGQLMALYCLAIYIITFYHQNFSKQ
jgi:hypothetical protein